MQRGFPGILRSTMGLYAASALPDNMVVAILVNTGNIMLSSRMERFAVDQCDTGVLGEKNVVAQEI